MHLFHRNKPKAMKATTKRERESLEQHLSAREVDARTDFARTTDPFTFVTEMLTASGANHTVIEHDKEYTSLKTATKAHVSGKGIGKGVLVRVEGLAAAPLGADAKPPGEKPPSQVIMCILRATDRIQLSKVAKQMRADSATLCTEAEVNAMVARLKLPLEAGAVPPLPDIYRVQGIIDAALAAEESLMFKAGNNSQLVQMSMKAFRELSVLTVGQFTEEIDVHLRELTQMLTTVGKARVGNCIVRHKPAATASEGAKALRFPGMCCLKAVVVRLDGRYAMCAVPCTRCVDLTRLAALASVTEARLATASELRERVPAAQPYTVGARMQHGPLPPFGNLFDMPNYIDVGNTPEAVSGAVDVAFSAGTVTESMTMRYGDFLFVLNKFQEPILGSFTIPAKAEVHTWASTQFKQHLQQQGVPYYTLKHTRTYTAAETAAEARVSGLKLAKTVVVKDGAVLALAVLRACDMLDLAALAKLADAQGGTSGGSGTLALAQEVDFADKFDNVEAGAMPPFGHLYGMQTYADSNLATCGTVYMNAGNHKELLAMSWESFAELVHPVIGDVALPRRRSSIGRKGSGSRASDAGAPPKHALAEA